MLLAGGTSTAAAMSGNTGIAIGAAAQLTPRPSSRLHWLTKAVILTVLYFIIARIGLRYAAIGESISPVWPPTGLALAALLVLGREYWPAVLAGAFLANAATAVPLTAAIGIACGNTAEAVVGAYVMRRLAGRAAVTLDDLAAVRTLVLVAAPLAALVSAAVGVTTLWLTGALPDQSDLASAIGLWWAGDFLGAVVVAPALLTWAAPSEGFGGTRRATELVVFGCGCIVLAELVLGRVFPASFLPPTTYPYLLFPVVIGAALRIGPRGASLMTLAVAMIAVVHAAQGGGPFVMQTVPSTAVALLLYIGVLAITGLTLGAVAARNQRAESALCDASENLRAVVQSSPLAIYALNAAGNVLTWNPAAESLFGWTAGDVLGRPLPIVPEEKDAEHRGLRARVLRGETLKGVELTRQRKDGSFVIVSLSAAPLYGAEGEVAGMLAIAADLSELRELEVHYRQSQKMEAIGRLAGGIAHDFNNILTAILGTSALLVMDLIPGSEAYQDVEEIRRSAERAAGLTRQLLVFSRQQVLEPRVLDVNDLVSSTRQMLRRLIGEHIELRTSLAPDLGAVRADPGQVEQVIMNLVVNARDAMPRGGVITIATANVDLDEAFAASHVPMPPGPYLRLAVSDTGVGMNAAIRARVFEPFFTTKEAGRGTGLGLATVYGIVKQSQGYIWVSSEPNKGSTFDVYLPRVGGAVESVLAEELPAQSLQGSEVVLVVEDQEDVLRLTRRVLEDQGYRVLSAHAGVEALRLSEYHSGPIHLLVTDVVMPGMNGREVALLLQPAHREMKVLYMSGYPDASVVRQGLLEPGLDFLQKPFSPQALARRVREVLDRRES
jgi:PAS domain S-box-containing protein